VVRPAETFVTSDRLEISPALFNQDDRRRRILLTLSMSRMVRHLWAAIRHESTQALMPVVDSERWRYGSAVTLGEGQRVSPLAAPAASIAVADLLP
jgi:hypothetical protein